MINYNITGKEDIFTAEKISSDQVLMVPIIVTISINSMGQSQVRK